MPQWGNQDYKRAVFEQLAKGSGGRRRPLPALRELLLRRPASRRRGGRRRGIPPGAVSSRAGRAAVPRPPAQKMQPDERAEIAQDLLESCTSAASPRPGSRRCSAWARPTPTRPAPDDVAKLAEYSRQNHPEVFRRVMADKPFLVRWLSKPLVAGLVGVIAGKLLNRAYDR